MKTVFQNLKKTDWLLAAVCLVFIALQVWLDLKTPDYMAEITTLVQTAGSTMGEILSAGGMMLVCSLGSLAASVVTAICAARIAATLGATLRGRLFSKVQSFSMEEIGRFSTASLITRSTNDVTQIQMLIVLGLQMLLRAPIMAVFAIYKIAGKQWEWTLATAVAVVVLLVVVGVCLLLATPKFRRMQKLTDDLNRVTRENLTGLRVVRAYNAEDYQETKFAQANAALTGNQLFAQRTLAFLLPSIQLVMSGLSLAIYWIGGVLIDQAGMQAKLTLFSDMMVFSQYAIQVVMAFMMLVMIFMILPRASVAAHRIGEVLHTHPTILDGTQASGDPACPGQVEFRNVSFRYPDAEEYVLKDISFTAKRGETVAIIGSTGCGKSTVVNLIPRFYDATEGQVLVDGVDVREYDQRSLRNKIGSPGPSPPTWPMGTTGRRPPPRPTCRPPWPPPRPRTLSPTWRGAMRGTWPRGAPTSPAGRSSGSPSPGPSPGSRRSSSSTTPSPPWTIRPTGSSAAPWTRPAKTPPGSSWPSASAPSGTPTRSSSWTTARSPA